MLGRALSPFFAESGFTKGEAMSGEPRSHFNEALAASFVGKYVLIGLTYYDHEGNFLEQKQRHGTITSADERAGFAIELQGQHRGETFWLPPDVRPFQKARPGNYRLRSTGEEIVDPDLLCSWSINNPPPEQARGKDNEEGTKK
jgi:hypothetical protein